MIYQNPIISGFYPDPSVCEANGKFYLVNSSFEYFPGVPLFESEDLVNWKQIGHVLTRKSQVMLEGVRSSGGVFAPTIRYSDGRFYMVTNNNSTNENFYVYTDDIYGEWSDPVVVDQEGIDPSLLFDEGKCYFISNGHDKDGRGCVIQSEIDITTGKKLTETRPIWRGAGGRYIESPHMYHIGNYYYLMVAEGGTEYGHMVAYARATNPWGPFENCPTNPVLTNRNLGPCPLQGAGHGDLICDKNGDWHIVCLAFRQVQLWMGHHTIGRETFMAPVTFNANGWFTVGNGTLEESYEIKGDFTQDKKTNFTFENTDWNLEWINLRHPNEASYEYATFEAADGSTKKKLILHGTDVTLDHVANPAFLGIRQTDYKFDLSVDLSLDKGIAGVSVYAYEEGHYDVILRKSDAGFEAVLMLNIGDIKHEQAKVSLSSNKATIKIKAVSVRYGFVVVDENGTETILGDAQSKFLSSEVNGGFTGVILAMFAIGDNTAEFTNFNLNYQPQDLWGYESLQM